MDRVHFTAFWLQHKVDLGGLQTMEKGVGRISHSFPMNINVHWSRPEKP